MSNQNLNRIERFFATATTAAKRNFMQAYMNDLNLYSPDMQPADPTRWVGAPGVLGVWHSRTHIATAWQENSDQLICRLSVNRAAIDPKTGSFLGGISWDELYLIKNQCGFMNLDAVEVYPAADKLVNVANMRHLWILKNPLPFSL